jgi:hypothetical protein
MRLWSKQEIEAENKKPILTLSFVKNRVGSSGSQARVELTFNKDKCKFERGKNEW